MKLNSEKAIMIKARAAKSRLLSKRMYDEILHKESAEAVLAYLISETEYAPSLADLQGMSSWRDDFEERLRRHLDGYYQGVLCFAPATDSFYSFVITEMEVEALTTILQDLMSQKGRASSKPPQPLPAVMLSATRLDFSRLAKASTFPDLLKELKGSPYYKPLLASASHSEIGFDFPVAERDLRDLQGKRMLEAISRIPSQEERSKLSAYYAALVELADLELLYRLKGFVAFSPGRISSYLVAKPAMLRQREWQSLIAASDRGSLMRLLGDTSLGKRMKQLSPNLSFEEAYFNTLTARLLYHNSHKLLKSAYEGPSAFLAMVTLARNEVRNLITIMEGKFYGMSVEKLSPYLVY